MPLLSSLLTNIASYFLSRRTKQTKNNCLVKSLTARDSIASATSIMIHLYIICTHRMVCFI